ncbi:MAG TPA: hypothetical protein PKO06_24545 [Candidatus Ozemobacteraceae bacterium]|nr:hypothetical protein [Candidatus Ozemobacteraceae bacterium]
MPKKPIHLTPDIRDSLKAVALSTGKTEEQLILEALDQYLARLEEKQGLDKLLAVAGMWKGRRDLTPLKNLRSTWKLRIDQRNSQGHTP